MYFQISVSLWRQGGDIRGSLLLRLLIITTMTMMAIVVAKTSAPTTPVATGTE